MAKSDKHKKRRKQDKAKTQLKGRTLAKAQNVVEPKLKSKKILIRDQLNASSLTSGTGTTTTESDGGVSIVSTVEVLTKKKQSLQEVLIAFNHHNKNVRRDALSGLLEIISTRSDILLANLDRILGKIGALTYDDETLVRKENLRAAELIFAQLNEEQIKPFWNLLLAHAKCALTNLNSNIRYGCLPFMSLLMSYFPDLCLQSDTMILPSLMSLISTTPVSNTSTTQQKPQQQNQKGNIKQKSKLKIEISDTTNTMKERSRVLSVIASYIELRKTSNASSNGHKDSIELDSESYDPTKFYFPYVYQDYQSKKDALRSNDTLASLCGDDDLNLQKNTSASNNSFWEEFVQTFVPVLWESWLEVKPVLQSNRKDMAVTKLGLSSDQIYKDGWEKVLCLWKNLGFYDVEKPNMGKCEKELLSQLMT